MKRSCNIDYNPITQQTVMGKLGRDAVSALATTAVIGLVLLLYGDAAMKAAIPGIAAVGGLFAAINAGSRAIRLGKLATALGGVGALADVVDMKSADDNISGSVAKTEFVQEATKRFPFLVNLATNDTDSIFTKTWKNT